MQARGHGWRQDGAKRGVKLPSNVYSSFNTDILVCGFPGLMHFHFWLKYLPLQTYIHNLGVIAMYFDVFITFCIICTGCTGSYPMMSRIKSN